MAFIFAILGPNHRVKLGNGAAQLHKFGPRSHSGCRASLPVVSRAIRICVRTLGARAGNGARARKGGVVKIRMV